MRGVSDKAQAECREDDPFDPTGWFVIGKPPVTKLDRRRKRISINVSFLWLLFPLTDLAHSDASPLRVGLVVAGMLGFVATYNWLPFARPPLANPRKVAGQLAVLTLLAAVLTLADRESWSLLFLFAGISGAMRLPRRGAVGWIFACTVFTVAANLLDHADAGTTISITATTLAIGFMMFAFRRLMELNAQLRNARGEVARLAVAEERLRFARELHDLVGHSLSVIAVKAELAERLLARDPARAVEHVTDVKDVARTALSQVREAVSGYRQPTLVDELAGARMALQAAGIEADLRGADVALPADVEAVLAWTVREGTTNVIRHSGASSCRIAVQPGLASASAEVVDDGHANGNGATPGNGLAGLRERAEQLAGRVEAGPGPQGGFRLLVTVPLRRTAT
jgi:two-component system sensor histidine kinase DesK